MSQPSSDPTIYDALMFVSVGAVIIGIILLSLALNRYGWSAPPSTILPALSSLI